MQRALWAIWIAAATLVGVFAVATTSMVSMAAPESIPPIKILASVRAIATAIISTINVL